jgi:oligopeptide/dipeptide ABC transporter ATP-binding protein
MTEPLIQVRDLEVHFPVREGVLVSRVSRWVRAVDGVTFDIERGETHGLVGESGCGKSTTGRGILQLVRPTGGQVLYGGRDLVQLRGRELRPLRRELQIVFQNPYASLDPRMTVGGIVAEPLKVHRLARGKALDARVRQLLEMVGLDPSHVRRFPHEFSGGQRQRIGIARALALEPKFIVADEPISALDVSIQAQILNLLQDLKRRLGLTLLFVAHDLAAVRHVSDRIAVMYLGKIVEIGKAEDVVRRPLHPYTQALLSSVPVPDPEIESKRVRVALHGDVPSPLAPPSGCRFRTRCAYAFDRCAIEEPPLHPWRPEHPVACHLLERPDPPHLGPSPARDAGSAPTHDAAGGMPTEVRGR